jgi:hypothetical protein
VDLERAQARGEEQQVTNAFVAALLKMAAEERQHEERLRVLASSWSYEDRSPYGKFTRWVIDDCHAKADEHAGRAEVYERFATRLIGEIAGELLTTEVFATLSGEAALLDVLPPFELEYGPTTWQMYSGPFWGRYTPIVSPPQSLIITATN